MPQTNYTQAQWRNGQIADASTHDTDSFTNELFAQHNTVPIGGTTDGLYRIQLDGPESEQLFIDFTASSNSADEIADGLAAFVLADPDLLNIVDASATSGTPLDLQFLHPGQEWLVSFPSNPGTNMTLTVTQVAGGLNIGLGLFVVRGSADAFAKLPTTATLDANVLGVTTEDLVFQVNSINPTVGTDNEAIPGDTIPATRRARVALLVEGAVAADTKARLRIGGTIPPGGKIGRLTAAPLVGNEVIELEGVVFKTSTTGNAIAVVSLDRN